MIKIGAQNIDYKFNQYKQQYTTYINTANWRDKSSNIRKWWLGDFIEELTHSSNQGIIAIYYIKCCKPA